MRTPFRPVRSWVLTVFLPPAFFAFSIIIEKVFGYTCFTACEDGPIENLEALVLFIAFCLGVSFLIRGWHRYPVWARVFFLIGVVGALYAALEEISYGQRIFGWATPESWGLINDQDETNLHNTSAWLDQKPRLILQIGVVIGGLIIPALRRWKPQWLPAKWSAVYPSDALILTAFFAIFIYLYRGFADAIGVPGLFLLERGSEAQEIYLYWFILLYFWEKRRALTV
jgi:glucan phosphoethanolaminetransferase (alkaline phosphatase superfamily)